MPRRTDQVSRIANEREVFENIDRARHEAALSNSPEGLTALAKGFWFRNEREKNRRNRR
jgi:hypothetical protein